MLGYFLHSKGGSAGRPAPVASADASGGAAGNTSSVLQPAEGAAAAGAVASCLSCSAYNCGSCKDGTGCTSCLEGTYLFNDTELGGRAGALPALHICSMHVPTARPPGSLALLWAGLDGRLPLLITAARPAICVLRLQAP